MGFGFVVWVFFFFLHEYEPFFSIFQGKKTTPCHSQKHTDPALPDLVRKLEQLPQSPNELLAVVYHLGLICINFK